MNVYIQVGVADANRWALIELLDEIVYNRILRAISYKLRVIEILGIDNRIDGEGLVERQILLPFDLFHLFIDGVGIFGLEMIDRLQDTKSRAAMEIRLVKQFFVSCERYHAAAYL